MIMLAAILALALAAAVPAIAQVGLEAGNEAESDDVATEFSVANEGDYASQCVPALQFGNTGKFNNTRRRSCSTPASPTTSSPAVSSSRSRPSCLQSALRRFSSRPRRLLSKPG